MHARCCYWASAPLRRTSAAGDGAGHMATTQRFRPLSSLSQSPSGRLPWKWRLGKARRWDLVESRNEKGVEKRGLYSFRSLSSVGKLSGGGAAGDGIGNTKDNVGDNFDGVFAIIGLGMSIAAAVGALALVSGDENKNTQKSNVNVQFKSLPRTKLPSRYSTSGTTESSLQVVATSVGESLSAEELLKRYDFHIQSVSEVSKPQIQVIGKGAYGRVVKATDLRTNQEVAMKVVPSKAMSAEALLNEVEVLRRVRGHDNIIHLNEVLECGGEYYVATELCEGGELLDRLIANGPYDETSASRLMDRICSAVQHVHRCGYVHLDIKPENLVFAGSKGTRDADSDDCRVIDFGMAKKLNEVNGNLQVSKSGTNFRIGTLAYWSPEQIRALEGYDRNGKQHDEPQPVFSDPRKCDMWALGVVLYIVLLGCHPFDPKGHGDEKRICRAVLRGKYRFDIHGDDLVLSEDAKDLINRLLDPNPETRLSSQQMLDHPFLASKRKRLAAMHRLPTSWIVDGFKGGPRSEVDKRLAHPDQRLASFMKPRCVDAYVRALLIAAISNGLQHQEKTGDELYRDAFRVFDAKNSGKITMKSIESLLGATNEASDVRKRAHLEDENERDGDNEREQCGANSNDDDVWSDDEMDELEAGDQSHMKRHPSNGYIDFEEFKGILRLNDCITRSFDKDTPVFSQGAEPQGFYVLTKGRARLEYVGEDGDSNEFAFLDAGSMIGETAVTKGDKKRFATVRCMEPSQVVYIPKDQFLRALAGSPALHSRVFQVSRSQQAQRLHDLMGFLKPKSLRIERFPKGYTIFHQGDKADALYLIQKGVVGTSICAPASRARGAEPMSVQLSQNGPGDIIGTTAISRGKRFSTAKCLTDVEASVISNEDLIELMSKESMVRFYLESQLQWRKEQWEERVADMERGVLEPQILPLLFLQSVDGTRMKKQSEHEQQQKHDQPPPLPSAERRPKTEIDHGSSLEEEPALQQQPSNGENSVSDGSWFKLRYLMSPWNYLLHRVRDGGEQKDSLAERISKQDEESLQAYEQYAKAISRMRSEQYSPGQVVFAKGEKPGKFYIVDSGIVTVEYTASTGEVMTVAQLGPGDHFGEQAILEDRPVYVGTVRCVTSADILSMNRDEFIELVDHGRTPFGKAIKHAMKQRQHRWVRNFLYLAKSLDGKESRERLVERIVLGPGEQLFAGGDDAEAVYFVHRGNVELIQDKTQKCSDHFGDFVGGKRVLKPGDIIGLGVFQKNAKHTCTAISASSRTVLSRVPRSTLETLIRNHDYISPQLKRHARKLAPLTELEQHGHGRGAGRNLNRTPSLSRFPIASLTQQRSSYI